MPADGTREFWSYERKRRCDRTGTRWHFASRLLLSPDIPYEERPFELYFRNDERSEFGLLRFEHRKDNPYRSYETMVTKIMNDVAFRRTLLDPETADVWRKNWK
jgi:hypothetical protein